MSKKSKSLYDGDMGKNYEYWENEFDGYKDYMVSDGENQFAIIRQMVFAFMEGSLLDVGCAAGGTYDWAKKLKKKFKYKGVDYAKGFIEANKSKFPEVEWEVCDARNLQEKDGSWDTVLLYDVLDALEDWEEAIKEADRVSRKRVIITMWMDAHMDHKRDYLRGLGYRVIEIDLQGDDMPYHKFLLGRK